MKNLKILTFLAALFLTFSIVIPFCSAEEGTTQSENYKLDQAVITTLNLRAMNLNKALHTMNSVSSMLAEYLDDSAKNSLARSAAYQTLLSDIQEMFKAELTLVNLLRDIETQRKDLTQ